MKNRFLLLTIIVFNACFLIIDIFPQDFQVSSHSAVGFWPHMATDSSGNFVIVWDDYRNVKIPYSGTGTDGDIYGRKYNKTGTPIGDDFRISDDSINTDVSYAGQVFPRVSMNKGGRFVVTWEDTRPKGTPSDGTMPLEFNIYAQMFDLNGQPVGTNFMVNDTATSGQINPDVIVRDDGSFVIIWNNTLDNQNIYLQVFDSNGNKISSNKKLSFTCGQPRIALFENGNYIVTGDSNAQIYSFPSEERGQAFEITAGYMRELKISKDDIIYATHIENRLGTDDQYVYSDIFIETYGHL